MDGGDGDCGGGGGVDEIISISVCIVFFLKVCIECFFVLYYVFIFFYLYVFG